ncbi:MAG: DNA recombination protein RmuC [Alphaproteobacteria bacterium]|nr:DNA recombination protein RmuC [Alphaproteobacteria bacterium]
MSNVIEYLLGAGFFVVILIGLPMAFRMGKNQALPQTDLAERDNLRNDIQLLRNDATKISLQKEFAERERDAARADLSQTKKNYEETRVKLEQTSRALAEYLAKRGAEEKAAQDKMELLEKARLELSNNFKALSAEALKTNNQQFLLLAQQNLEKFQQAAQGDLDKRNLAIKELVAPISEKLEKFDRTVQEIEKQRSGAYEGILKQVQELSSETKLLGRALSKPQVRGSWGEMQLRRIVELAGLRNRCDFSEQNSIGTDNGRLRPDLVVHLAGEKNIVIDAKTPLTAYLRSVEMVDEAARQALLQEHADAVYKHISDLAKKEYWAVVGDSAEFVVLFMPGDHFWAAALEQRPDLMEYAAEKRIIVATPMMLIALLSIIALGWKEEAIAKNAQDIANLGHDLHERLLVFSRHLGNIGRGLKNANDSYDEAVGSFNTRLLNKAREFEKLESSRAGKELPEEIKRLDFKPRTPVE